MELLLKRERKGGRYQLFAKLEAKPEEREILNKSRLKNSLVWEDPVGDSGRKGEARSFGVTMFVVASLVLMLVFAWVGGIGHSINANYFVYWLGGAMLSIPVWPIVSFWYFRKYRERVSVSDLLNGRTMRGDEESLRVKEMAIREAATKINEHIRGWRAQGEWGGEGERISL